MALHASRYSAFLLTSLSSFDIIHYLTPSNHIFLGLPFALLPVIFPSSAFLPLLAVNTCPAYAIRQLKDGIFCAILQLEYGICWTLSVVGVAGELYPRERKKFWGAHSLI